MHIHNNVEYLNVTTRIYLWYKWPHVIHLQRVGVRVPLRTRNRSRSLWRDHPPSGSRGRMTAKNDSYRVTFWLECTTVVVPVQWQEGSTVSFLMVVSTSGHLLVLGGNPLYGSDALDSRMGACLWDLSLGQRTGDGEVWWGDVFGWVVDFFLGGPRGEEKASGHGQQGRSLDDARFQTAPFCFILYIAQWKFRFSMSSHHLERWPPDPRCPGQTGVLFRLRG